MTENQKIKLYVKIMESVFCALHPELFERKNKSVIIKENLKIRSNKAFYKNALDVLQDAVKKLDDKIVRPCILEDKIEKDEYGTDTFTLCGGLNGGGPFTKWKGYFQELSKFVTEVSKKYHIWLIKLDNDCLDDVFYAEFGIDEITEEDKELSVQLTESSRLLG